MIHRITLCAYPIYYRHPVEMYNILLYTDQSRHPSIRGVLASVLHNLTQYSLPAS